MNAQFHPQSNESINRARWTFLAIWEELKVAVGLLPQYAIILFQPDRLETFKLHAKIRILSFKTRILRESNAQALRQMEIVLEDQRVLILENLNLRKQIFSRLFSQPGVADGGDDV